MCQWHGAASHWRLTPRRQDQQEQPSQREQLAFGRSRLEAARDLCNPGLVGRVRLEEGLVQYPRSEAAAGCAAWQAD